MTTSSAYILTLENFEGPLDFLLHLVQKSEIDLYEISIQQITDQYLRHLKEKATEKQIDQGAEFIHLAATLHLLKSRMLLPRQEQQEQLLDHPELDLQFNVIHQLIDYCRFKEAAKSLSEREMQQGGFYSRGCDEIGEPAKPLGISHVSLQDLALLFQQLLTKAKNHHGLILEEHWKVSDKIKFIRQLITELRAVPFMELFSAEASREELIVTFLALLELMKLGELSVIKENDIITIKSS